MYYVPTYGTSTQVVVWSRKKTENEPRFHVSITAAQADKYLWLQQSTESFDQLCPCTEDKSQMLVSAEPSLKYRAMKWKENIWRYLTFSFCTVNIYYIGYSLFMIDMTAILYVWHCALQFWIRMKGVRRPLNIGIFIIQKEQEQCCLLELIYLSN